MTWALALLLVASGAAGEAATAADPAVDPRIEWVELQRSGRLAEALERVEEHLQAAAGSPVTGARYLKGRLLSTLGRHEAAAAELAAALTAEPTLEPWIRFRLAETHVEQGHPEVAAGLLATLLAGNPTETLRSHTTRLLAETLRRGGDCRLLARLDSWTLDDSERRILRLERAACTRRRDPEAAEHELVALLAERSTDGIALAAAEALAGNAIAPTASVALDMAMAFFGQRDFEQALEYFTIALAPGGLPVAARTDHETGYAVARSYFWLGQYREAGERFAALAAGAPRPQLAAQAHYQQARCFELAGDRTSAEQAYDRAFRAEPDGSWSGSALSARLRLLWLMGDQGTALDLYGRLGTHRRWRASRARAALFLAASDLVQGRTDRAADWLNTAAITRDTHAPEVAYWRGRLAEEEGDRTGAVAHFRRALAADPWDPWSREARARITAPSSDAARREAVAELVASGRDSDLLQAWLIDPGTMAGSEARQRLVQRLSSRTGSRAFLGLAAVPTPAWPLWSDPLAASEDRLLAVGDWQLGLPAAARHFPIDEERLGLTRARALAEAGLTRASIRTAEVVSRRAPPSVAAPLWPDELAHSLYPLAYGGLVRRHAQAAGLDPLLLAAIIREESRFDPRATSAAAARGLTQFVLPTARRLARTLDMGEIEASDLYRPEVSIRLAGAYLQELGALFDGVPHKMLAAYNAGEPQAGLWTGYCFSDEPAEYFTKVGFRETRGYLRKVLRSRARYAELYPAFGSEAATTPGSSASTTSK